MKILRSRIRLLSFVLSVIFLVILLIGTQVFWQDLIPAAEESPSPSVEAPAASSGPEPDSEPTPEPQYVTFGL